MQGTQPASSSPLARGLVAVALGERPADLVVRNARLLNVYTGEVLEGQAVATLGERIALVGPAAEQSVGAGTRVIDADGMLLLPGFVEGHTHLTRYGPEELVRYAAAHGVTTIVLETAEIAALLGYRGIVELLDGLAGQPIKVFATVAPLASLSPILAELAPSPEQYDELLARPEVVGLGETYWADALRDDRLLALAALAARRGKTAEGHTAGARGAKLQAYVAAGYTSCHEPISAEEGLERLRLGLHWMARHGHIRSDLAAFAPLWASSREQAGALPPVDLRRLVLVSDSVGPEMLLERGYLDEIVREAIRLGLDPVAAVRAVTLNVAEHFRLDHLVGGIAPGRYADLVLVPDLRTVEPRLVVSNGQVVAEQGRTLVEPRPIAWSRRTLNSVRRPRLPEPADFRIRSGSGAARVRVIDLVTHLVSREGEATLPSSDGELRARPEEGLLKVAALDRSGRTASLFVGFVRGFGLRRGALATTAAWDSSCLVVVGADDRDLALAACRLIDTQGGAAVCADGELLAEIQTPIAGVLSPAPLPVVVEQVRLVQEAARELGCPWPDAILAADVLTTPAIPHFRITERGYVRVRDGALLPLFVEGAP